MLDKRVTVRMSPEMIARLDAWIAGQSGYVSRQDAVRYCIECMFGGASLSDAPGFRVEQPAPEASDGLARGPSA